MAGTDRGSIDAAPASRKKRRSTPAAWVILILAVASQVNQSAPARRNVPEGGFRGVHFNPQLKPGDDYYPWLCFYTEHRARVQELLRDAVDTARLNLVDIYVCMPHTLKNSVKAPGASEHVTSWANLTCLDGVAAFVDDCSAAGLSVEIDLACNLWAPAGIEPEKQIANSGHWPMPDETPWDEAARWYRGVIEYVEAHARHPEAIALWCMTGNHEFGAAEPCLWEREDNPAVLAAAAEFVKHVWPEFRAAGRRPKAAPILLPIFASGAYWDAKSSAVRLSAFSNLRRWLVDDLALPPDYWVMTSYPFCDPAPDGFAYLKAIVDILGPGNAGRIIATDFKGPGHDLSGSILAGAGADGSDALSWHFGKCRAYGFAGWWIWAYQDTSRERNGLCDAAGAWKRELVAALRAASGSESGN